jgi:hypothetical protein
MEILQLPALKSSLSSEYPATELFQLSTQLQRDLLSASLAELNLTADPQLTASQAGGHFTPTS